MYQECTGRERLQMSTNALGNSSFSRLVPDLQLGVDSTSLGTYKECPRKYYYSIILGLVPREESPHLTFGLLLHKAREDYDRARLSGRSHEQALDLVLDAVLRSTWNKALKRPSLGDHKTKNRMSLVRTVVWYLDVMAQKDSFETLRLANGQPAVELSFRFAPGWYTAEGEEIILCGHLDRIGLLNGIPYILDVKTTSQSLGESFFKQFSPHNQFSLYTLAGQVVYEQPIKSIIVDGVQVGVGFSRFQRKLIERSEEQLVEWLGETQEWIEEMGDSARRGRWKLNDKSCDHYGGCPFREVCGSSPSAREHRLKKDFVKRVWDPLQARGDI